MRRRRLEPVVKRPVPNPRVKRTRCGGQWTEARFFGFLRSALRGASQRWDPLVKQSLELVKRKSQSKTNKRLKWEYQCKICGLWYSRKLVRVDHIEPCGSLKTFDDLPGFVERLFCEVDGLQVLCVDCDLDRGGVNDGKESGEGE